MPMAALETLTLTRQSAPKIWSIQNMLNAPLDEKKKTNKITQNTPQTDWYVVKNHNWAN